MMTKAQNGITIIVPTPAAAPDTKKRKADEGGEVHGLSEAFVQRLGFGAKTATSIEEQLQKIIGQLQGVLAAVAASPVGQMRLAGIDVGLAISAEGSIGIATAGVETSITLSFERTEA